MSELSVHGAELAARAGAVEAARRAIARAQAEAQEDRADEALAWYAEALKLPIDHVIGLAVRADALRGAGMVHQSRAEWAEAERDFHASRDAAIQLGDEGRIGRAENCLGAVAFERGEWPVAERYYAAAEESAQGSEDRELLAQVENNRGTLLAARGEHALAELSFRRALERFEELEQHPCVARVLNNLGLSIAHQGRYPQAAIAYDRALADCKRRGDALFATKILINQARLALARQDPVAGHAAAMKAWTFARRLKDGPVAAGALCLLGEVALAFRDFVGAIYYLRRALKLAADDKAPLVEAETWVQIGNLYHRQGKIDRAVDTWQFARLCYRRLGAQAEEQRLGEWIDATVEVAALESSTADTPAVLPQDVEPVVAGALFASAAPTGTYGA